MTNDDTLHVLNHLAEVSEDNTKGFSDVAGEVTNPELRSFLQRRSDDCGADMMELRSLLQSLDNSARSDRMTWAVRPGWQKIGTTIEDANLTALKEVEDAAEQSDSAYAEALITILPRQVRVVLERQHESVKRNRVHIRDLRISYKAARA